MFAFVLQLKAPKFSSMFTLSLIINVFTEMNFITLKKIVQVAISISWGSKTESTSKTSITKAYSPTKNKTRST